VRKLISKIVGDRTWHNELRQFKLLKPTGYVMHQQV